MCCTACKVNGKEGRRINATRGCMLLEPTSIRILGKNRSGKGVIHSKMPRHHHQLRLGKMCNISTKSLLSRSLISRPKISNLSIQTNYRKVLIGRKIGSIGRKDIWLLPLEKAKHQLIALKERICQNSLAWLSLIGPHQELMEVMR